MPSSKPATGNRAPAADPYAAAVEQMRDTARWILSLFAGLGAVLIAGTQFSSIGRLDAVRPAHHG